MEHSSIQFIDLPDEILLIIFTKLNTIDALNSLLGVNKQLDNIIQDPIFTSHLTLFRWSSNDRIDPLDHKVVNQFCLQILPQIHDKIKCLNLELLSMGRILRATNYPNLCELGLYNIDENTATYLFYHEQSFFHTFKKQISSLTIKLDDKKQPLIRNILTYIFTYILTMFTNLCYLNFQASLIYSQQVSFDIVPRKLIFSSTLLELHVNLENFNDCLYLLNGRFNQLHTFHVNISTIRSDPTIDNKEKLFNLKYFSLTCDVKTYVYDKLIVPLLQRMSNLEKLDLHLLIDHNKIFVDGNDLKKNIINYLSYLKIFQFDIYSFISIYNQINLPSKEDIQHTLTNLGNNQIISCVNYFSKSKIGYCHIYSYPLSNRITYYHNITNNFPDGLFKYVRKISLFDEYSFEYEFFIRISQSFPFIEYLSLKNQTPQNHKQYQETNLSIVQFLHLTELDFQEAHDDYIEQFLIDTKTSLPNNILFDIDYHQLKRVTHTFTRAATRNNCAKLVLSFLSFDVLPLVEFILPSDINDEDALNLLEQVPNSQLENSTSSTKINQSTTNRLVITEQGNTTRAEDKDPFLKKMSKYSSNPDEYRPVVVDRALLKAMDPSLVFVCKWPFPLRWKWYRIIVPEQPVGRCRHCNKFFHNDEFELALLEQGGCPFCRNKRDSDLTGEYISLIIFSKDLFFIRVI
ncbi:unnamed protein product [Rotaria sp. Silwood2]|nr:unnamed protein product [Rotaria sp. Silwood2]CAF4037416.1 unnamed protein product [Rotaria sp. Silwood2]